MSEKIFYPGREDYQDLEDFICGGSEQQYLFPYNPPIYPPTYPSTTPLYPFYTITDNTGSVTDYHNYTTCSYSVSPKETIFPSGDKFIFYA